jgi:predicted MFS family arabinose efflux permease
MPNAERKLLRVLYLPFLLEASQYAALAPLLPHYVRMLRIGHPAAGVLMSSYAAGVIVGALIGGGALAAWIGVRSTVLLGLLLLAAVNAAFAAAHGILALDAIRCGQGVAGGCIWAGGLSWFLGSAAPERRGRGLGIVLGVAMLGTIAGPLIGTAALAIGVRATFVGLALAALVSVVFAARVSAPATAAPERSQPLRSALRSPLIAIGVWLLLVEAVAIGALYVLVPLRLDELGASGAAIGVTFALASLLAALSTRLTGRASDRFGPLPPAAIALLASVMLLGAMSLAGAAAALEALVAIGIGAALVPIGVPACVLIIRGAEREGIAVGVTSIVITVCFATGEVAGGPLAAWLSGATSASAPYAIVALLELATLGVLLLAASRRQLAPDVPPQPSHGG